MTPREVVRCGPPRRPGGIVLEHLTAEKAVDIPVPEAIIGRLKATARDLGPTGVDRRYGAGLIDAGAATDPAVVVAPAPAAP